MIDIDDLSVSFGETSVFESISTRIGEGKFLGLVGPNGAGKSTLLRTLSGAVTPDSGSVRIDGANVEARTSREHSRLVSVVPQDTSLAFSFEVRHFVEMGRTPYRSRFSPPDELDRARVDRALDRTNTTQFETRSVDELSGGERQRVVLARALAQNTPVILLDEPTGSLDVNHQVEILSLVADLADGGKTVVAAIHDLDLAARFCDEVLVLAGGTIVNRGPPASVIECETIERAFDTHNAVTRNPVTGTPSVTALPDETARRAVPDRVHVVGTGLATARIVSILSETGTDLSIGPVPAGDVAAVSASHRDVAVHDAPAFAPLDERSLRTLETSLTAADVAVDVDSRPLSSDERVTSLLRSVPTVSIAESERTDDRAAGAIDRVLDPEVTRDALLEALSSIAASDGPRAPSPTR